MYICGSGEFHGGIWALRVGNKRILVATAAGSHSPRGYSPRVSISALGYENPINFRSPNANNNFPYAPYFEV